jgi:hypothetical protein
MSEIELNEMDARNRAYDAVFAEIRKNQSAVELNAAIWRHVHVALDAALGPVDGEVEAAIERLVRERDEARETLRLVRRSALAEMSADGLDIPVMVCMTHGRFVPCRRDEPHRKSTDLADVARVRAYQNGDVPTWTEPGHEEEA